MGLINLKNRSRTVRNETQFKANTASRVGQILMDIVDYLSDLFTDKHNHTNKAVLDELGDSGNKLTYRGLIIEGSSDTSISTWINPPVLKIVAALPLSGNTEDDRYILQGTGRIYTYTSGSWVLDPATDPNPTEGSAVIVRYDGDDVLVNAIHVYEDGAWEDKSNEFTFDESLFTTKHDTEQGRQNIPITGSPNDISQTGFYFGSDNVSGSPLYDSGGGVFTEILTYKHESYDEDNAYQSAQSFGDVKRWFRRKKLGVWGGWIELTTKAYVDGLVSGAIILQGAWDANTNTPDITGETTKGYAWRVSVAGSTDLGGITDWRVGDLAVIVATGWLKIDNEDISAIWGNITGDITNQTDLIGIIFWEADGGNHVKPKDSRTVKIAYIDPTALVDKATPVDADYMPLWDTVAVAWKKLTLANLKTTLYTAFELAYAMWESVGGVTKLKTARDIDVQSKKLENVASGTATTDGINKGQLDTVQGEIPDASNIDPQDHGTKAPGVSDDYSRTDHVHESDNTNTMREPATAAPQDHGTAATGSSDKYAREDHVHNSELDPFNTLTITSGTPDTAIWDCTTGLNKRVFPDDDFTLGITNFLNGYFGVITIDCVGVTGTADLTLDTGATPNKGNGLLTGLEANEVYCLAWYFDGNSIMYNIAKYE